MTFVKYGTLLSMIDHTLLKPTATDKDLYDLCKEASQHKFGAVCVRPYDVQKAAAILKNYPTEICTVIGFPWGIQTSKSKLYEIIDTRTNGATEFDMVINQGLVKDGLFGAVGLEIEDLAKEVHNYKDHKLKVIIETANLTDQEIEECCIVSEHAGADFVKTSTGLYAGATEHHVKLMKDSVKNIEVKASGGIKTWEDAYKMVQAGASRLGTSSGIDIAQEYLAAHKKTQP